MTHMNYSIENCDIGFINECRKGWELFNKVTINASELKQ